MGMISNVAIMRAAHVLYSDDFMSEFEELGGRIGAACQGPNGVKIEEVVKVLPEIVQMPIIYTLVGRLEQAWGNDPGLVYHHMWNWLSNNRAAYLTSTNRSDYQQFCEDALYYTLMACKGHGIGLLDDSEMQEAWDHASSILSLKGLKETPFHFEGTEWRDAASELLLKRKGYDKDYWTLPRKLKVAE